MSEDNKVIEGQFRVLGGEVDKYRGSGEPPSGTVDRRGFLKTGVAALATAIGGVALGRATSGGTKEDNPKGGRATIVLDRERWYGSTGGVLRETHLSGKRNPLEGLYESRVDLLDTSQKRTGVPELAGQFGLTRIQTAYGPVFQLDIPVAVLQKIPLSDLTVGFSFDNEESPREAIPRMVDAVYLSTRDIVHILNVQHPDHSTAADDKASFFFYRRDPQKGDLVQEENGKSILNVISIGEHNPQLSDTNLAIRIRVDHSGEPKFNVDSISRKSGWIDQSEGKGALEMIVKPKAIGSTQQQPAPSTNI